jgi:hypothetical protein
MVGLQSNPAPQDPTQAKTTVTRAAVLFLKIVSLGYLLLGLAGLWRLFAVWAHLPRWVIFQAINVLLSPVLFVDLLIHPLPTAEGLVSKIFGLFSSSSNSLIVAPFFISSLLSFVGGMLAFRAGRDMLLGKRIGYKIMFTFVVSMLIIMAWDVRDFLAFAGLASTAWPTYRIIISSVITLLSLLCYVRASRQSSVDQPIRKFD